MLRKVVDPFFLIFFSLIYFHVSRAADFYTFAESREKWNVQDVVLSVIFDTLDNSPSVNLLFIIYKLQVN